MDKHFYADLYRTMYRIRTFEKKVCANLTHQDYIQSTHRGHGHTIAKGAQTDRMMAELFGKKTGYCKGKGGSMHIADFSVGMLGANGIVGGGYTLATGAALAEKIKKTQNVSVVFFGDGASNRGTFHEALNMAAAWKLPVVFVCENNEWASTTPYQTTTSVKDISVRAKGYDVPGVIVDGNNVLEVYEVSKEAIDRARKGQGPSIVEMKTLRIKGHYVGDPEMYRTAEEVQKRFRENDPITRFEATLLENELLSRKEIDGIIREIDEEIEAAVKFALESPFPDESELYDDLYID